MGLGENKTKFGLKKNQTGFTGPYFTANVYNVNDSSTLGLAIEFIYCVFVLRSAAENPTFSPLFILISPTHSPVWLVSPNCINFNLSSPSSLSYVSPIVFFIRLWRPAVIS